MRIVFIGCVQFSFEMLKHLLLNVSEAEVVGVVTRRQSRFNTDFSPLDSLAEEFNVPCYYADETNQIEMADWVKKLKPDVIYCFGWSYLLKKDVIDIPPIGVIGYHPAALPANRGRHPIIWALALGLSETASTFFFIDEGTDTGDILSQVFVSIEEKDDALSLYKKLISVALLQVEKFTKALVNNTYLRVSQDHSCANYWRKRTVEDGKIDWRMPARGLYNLVRALTRPYIGAHCIYQDQEVKIWRTEITNLEYRNIEPGKVITIEEGSTILIKCGDGVLRLVEHEFEILPKAGEYL